MEIGASRKMLSSCGDIYGDQLEVAFGLGFIPPLGVRLFVLLTLDKESYLRPLLHLPAPSCNLISTY